MSRSRRRPPAPPTDPGVRDAARPLLARLDDVGILDAHRLRSRIRRTESLEAVAALEREVASAESRLEARRASVPEIRYPEQLPVTARREEIAAAIRDHQVVVVAGETGSGKTTQIPKICLDLGRGIRGMIGHTQPRRLAARTVAERIAEEMGVEIGGLVGSAVRFDDKTGTDTAVKLMTDGILLAEIRRDRLLRAYDTIILDEAHERSLNIDFLLGYLAQILPNRPDLKVVITSATIDPDRFARHFAAVDGTPAPVVEVSGRTFPVEIRYRPLEVEHGGRVVDLDPMDALADAVGELLEEGRGEDTGDVLVFLSGEREIRDAEEVLRGRRFRDTEVLPLFARLTTAEQNKAFRRHSGRRVVLSTNIAETSVTVPGIRYVVDTGLARISRYSVRTKVQRLPIEPVSQASADQRSGRCGRVADGICIRLYSEDDYEGRPEFTDPEILRTNLASVILSMADLDLGPVEDFPFVDPPDPKAVRDGRALLVELGALEEDDRGRPRLTRLGRDMASLPLDPRLSRMLAEAHRNGSLAEVLVIVAALTVQDVRERPAEEREKADQLHRRFADETSDFLGYLTLWRYLTEQRRELSGSAFRRMCRAEYLHWLRIREWQDLVGRLTGICRDHGWHPSSGEACDDDIHRALLTGLLSNVGMRVEEAREFLGARGIRFQVFPGSDLARKPPRWVMASELVETSRLWARDVARIDPAWVETAARHLVKRQYSEPHWSSSQGAAMAYEKVTLFGLPVVEGRRLLLSRVDPLLARELLIRHGVVEGAWRTRIPVFEDNARTVAEAREMEIRSRRRDLVVDDEGLVAFYDSKIPADVVSGRHLEAWWRKTGSLDPDALRLTDADLRTSAEAPSATDFPSAWRQGDLSFELEYTFDPAVDADGISVRIPLAQLPAVSASGFEWLVPGTRLELYAAMLRTLPKYLRRLCSPPGEYADLLASDVQPRSAPLSVALARTLSARIGASVEPGEFRPSELPAHLRMRFDVVDGGKVVASGTDLPALRRRLDSRVRERLASRLIEDDGPHRDWTASTFGDLPTEVTGEVDDATVTVYPALSSRPDGLHRVACSTPAEQRSTQTATVLEILRTGLPGPAPYLRGRPVTVRFALTQYPHGGADALVADASIGALAALVAERGGPVYTVGELDELRRLAVDRVPARVSTRFASALPALEELLTLWHDLDRAEPAVADEIRSGLDFLLGRGFLARHTDDRLAHLHRHVRAAATRLDLALRDPNRHARLTEQMRPIEETVASAVAVLRGRPGGVRRGRDLQWILAEYRVSVFAQSLGTAGPVSPERIAKAVAAALTTR